MCGLHWKGPLHGESRPSRSPASSPPSPAPRAHLLLKHVGKDHPVLRLRLWVVARDQLAGADHGQQLCGGRAEAGGACAAGAGAAKRRQAACPLVRPLGRLEGGCKGEAASEPPQAPWQRGCPAGCAAPLNAALACSTLRAASCLLGAAAGAAASLPLALTPPSPPARSAWLPLGRLDIVLPESCRDRDASWPTVASAASVGMAAYAVALLSRKGAPQPGVKWPGRATAGCLTPKHLQWNKNKACLHPLLVAPPVQVSLRRFACRRLRDERRSCMIVIVIWIVN